MPELADFATYDGAIDVDCAVLFSDFGGSTDLVEAHDRGFAIWLLREYLNCCARTAKEEGGTIGAFEGDGVMALFSGPFKEERAIRTALRIQWQISNVIQQKVDEFFPEKHYSVCHVAGIDTSPLSACRTGVWQDYDILWVGRAANVSANLTRIQDIRFSTYVSRAVYDSVTANPHLEHVVWEQYPLQVHGLDIYRTGDRLDHSSHGTTTSPTHEK